MSPTSPPWADGRSRWSMRSGPRAKADAAPVLAGLRAASRRLSACRLSAATPMSAPIAASCRSRSSAAPKRLLTSLRRAAAATAWSRRSICAAATASRSPIGKPRPTRRPARLAADLELLPAIAEAGLARAAKDISQGGIVGTAMMLAECSRVGADDRRRARAAAGRRGARALAADLPELRLSAGGAPANVPAVLARFSGARHRARPRSANSRRIAASPSPTVRPTRRSGISRASR